MKTVSLVGGVYRMLLAYGSSHNVTLWRSRASQRGLSGRPRADGAAAGEGKDNARAWRGRERAGTFAPAAASLCLRRPLRGAVRRGMRTIRW